MGVSNAMLLGSGIGGEAASLYSRTYQAAVQAAEAVIKKCWCMRNCGCGCHGAINMDHGATPCCGAGSYQHTICESK